MAAPLGPYELLGLLGRGGMAEVYLARRRVGAVEKRLVVKRLRRDRLGDARSLERLIREARLSMSLAHQNIVTVFDFGRLGDDVFLVMEYVEGHDLASTWGRPGAAPMPPLCAAHVVAQCCLGLDHAHRREDATGTPLGLVHFDVSPGNVLVSAAGEVKLADLGVAGLAGDPTGSVRGTAMYMAPEQARGERVDPRADVYAAGMVLWEALTGTRPRAGDGLDELLAAARAGVGPPEAPPCVPPALATIVARATAADPDARYPTARAMFGELDAYLVAARAAAPGATLVELLTDWYAAAWSGVPSTVTPLPDGVVAQLASGPAPQSMVVTADDTPAAPPPAIEARPPRRRVRRWWFAAPLVIGGAAAAGMAVARRPAPSTIASAVAVREPDAPAIAPPIARAPIAPAPVTPPIDPGPEAPPPIAPTPVAPAPRSPSGPPRSVGGATTGPPTAVPVRASPAAPTRAVTIGAQPWANFTVDDDPTIHQTPETVRLPAGAHRVHFANPTLGLARTITLDVPADRDLRHVERLDPP